MSCGGCELSHDVSASSSRDSVALTIEFARCAAADKCDAMFTASSARIELIFWFGVSSGILFSLICVD
jgi:hypothetical protein